MNKNESRNVCTCMFQNDCIKLDNSFFVVFVIRFRVFFVDKVYLDKTPPARGQNIGRCTRKAIQRLEANRMRISQVRSTTAPEESIPSTSSERRQILYFNCNFISKWNIMSHFVFH